MTQYPYERPITEDRSADTMAPGGRTVASEGRSASMACRMPQRGFKGLVLMMACCAAPLLLVLALPVLGIRLEGGIALSVHTLAVFACPVGMTLMMWIMRGGRAEAQPPLEEPPVKAAHLCEDACVSSSMRPSPLGTCDTFCEGASRRQEGTTRSIR
jgi:hypothetical protein